jgi:uncharacterized protein YutE (UPF0331/DUF86 family)
MDNSQARLLLSWAGLEALARLFAPEETLKPQSPARVAEVLAAYGLIGDDQQRTLRDLAVQRNQLIHGNLLQEVSDQSLQALQEIMTGIIHRAHEG